MNWVLEWWGRGGAGTSLHMRKQVAGEGRGLLSAPLGPILPCCWEQRLLPSASLPGQAISVLGQGVAQGSRPMGKALARLSSVYHAPALRLRSGVSALELACQGQGEQPGGLSCVLISRDPAWFVLGALAELSPAGVGEGPVPCPAPSCWVRSEHRKHVCPVIRD